MNEAALNLDGLQSGSGGPLYLKLRQTIEDAINGGRLKHGDALPGKRYCRKRQRKPRDGEKGRRRSGSRWPSGTQAWLGHVRCEANNTHAATPDKADLVYRGHASQGYDSQHAMARPGTFYPTGDEMMTLGLSHSAMVARLTRLRLANDQPIALEVTTLPDDILPEPQQVENSLYLVLERNGIRPVRAIQRISARTLTDEETLLLGVPPGSAALPCNAWPIWRVGVSWKYHTRFTEVTPTTS